VDERTAVLRGGTRDGETTPVAHEVSRLLAPSRAPGLVDVYESTGERTHVRGGGDEGEVFAFAGQEPVDGVSPESLHMPSGG